VDGDVESFLISVQISTIVSVWWQGLIYKRNRL